ncbi:ABC transporter permease [Kineosporia sp. A_224]|uniref:ABC transporter permease n=1 Tax=Kineosporia sp. A_224 TaxID=1962180 RepID=UPI000B4B79F6|nr:ABC transporter permease [Kineosporia sp. A_224]
MTAPTVAGPGTLTGLRTALAVESAKVRASLVLRSTSVLLVAGVCLLSAAMVAAVRAGRTDVTRKLGPAVATGDWDAFLAVATQVTGAAAVLATGVALAWLVGREFSDGTVGGLFGLPVTRSTIAAAKVLVYLGWAAGLGVVLPCALLAAGLACGLGAPGAAVFAGLARVGLLVVLSACVAVPAALAATLGRGLLPGVATTVGVVVVAQVGATLGAGTWFPLTAPALWAIAPGTVPPGALATAPLLALAVAALTVLAWRRLQLDR